MDQLQVEVLQSVATVLAVGSTAVVCHSCSRHGVGGRRHPLKRGSCPVGDAKECCRNLLWSWGVVGVTGGQHQTWLKSV